MQGRQSISIISDAFRDIWELEGTPPSKFCASRGRIAFPHPSSPPHEVKLEALRGRKSVFGMILTEFLKSKRKPKTPKHYEQFQNDYEKL